MTPTHWVWSLVPLAAASVALVGNYRLQIRVARRVRDAEDLKRRLYEFLDVVAVYWIGEQRDLVLEAKS